MDRDKPTWKRQDLYYTGIIGRRRGRGKLHFHFKKLLFSFIWSRCGKCESEGSQSKNKCSESSGQVLSLCFVSSISFCHCPWSGEVTFSSGRERQKTKHQTLALHNFTYRQIQACLQSLVNNIVCRGTHPVLHKHMLLSILLHKSMHFAHVSVFVSFFVWGFVSFLCCHLICPSFRLPLFPFPSLYLAFHPHLDFLPKKSPLLSKCCFSLALSLSLYFSTWLLSCRKDPFISFLWKTHTRTVVRADYPRSVQSADSYFSFISWFLVVPTTHRKG